MESSEQLSRKELHQFWIMWIKDSVEQALHERIVCDDNSRQLRAQLQSLDHAAFSNTFKKRSTSAKPSICYNSVFTKVAKIEWE